MSLKEIRMSKKITQEKAADILGVSRKTYIKYEKNESVLQNNKLKFFCNELSQYNLIDEEHGILSIKEIKEISTKVFNNFDVKFAYLFGSYAKGKAKDNSDIDILVDIPVDGIVYFELVETLREELHKKIDLLDLNQLKNNFELTKEILKDGIKIYGEYKE